MSSPLENTIYTDRFNTYVASGLFIKRTVVGSGTSAHFVEDPSDLPDKLKDMIHQDATALALTWLTWQTDQGVAVINHIDGLPDVGNKLTTPPTGLVP